MEMYSSLAMVIIYWFVTITFPPNFCIVRCLCWCFSLCILDGQLALCSVEKKPVSFARVSFYFFFHPKGAGCHIGAASKIREHLSCEQGKKMFQKAVDHATMGDGAHTEGDISFLQKFPMSHSSSRKLDLGYDAAQWIFSIMLDVFFREIRPRGSHKIPRQGPVIFVAAPHANQVSQSVIGRANSTRQPNEI